MMKYTYITPVPGQVYTNKNGDTYICRNRNSDIPGHSMTATFERQKDGWTLIAHGIAQYDDGTIEWDFSTGGHWPYGIPRPY